MTFQPPSDTTPLPPPVQAPPPPPAKKFPWTIVIIVTVVICLICVAVGVLGGVGKRLLEKQVDTLLTTPIAEELATQQTEVTATTESVAEPTAEVAAPTEEATATTEAPAPAEGGNQVSNAETFKDDFSSNQLGWEVSEDGNRTMGLDEGGYEIRVFALDDYYSTIIPAEFDPQYVAFDMTNLDDPFDGTYGVMCQYEDDANHLYVELTVPEGYIVAKVINNEYELLSEADDPENSEWARTRTIRQGQGETNHVEVSCTTDSISLRVNGEDVYSAVLDEPIGKPGPSALFVYTIESADEDGFGVRFDNIEASPNPMP